MKVQVFLKTPLLKANYGTGGAKASGPVWALRGDATARDGGLDLRLETATDDKDRPVLAPFTRVFVPLAKIDHYVIDDA